MSALDTKIQALTDAVAKETQVEQSVLTFIQGVPALIADAVTKAQEAGATDAQLQALSDLQTTITTNAQALADAVTANTPVAPVTDPTAPGSPA